MAGSVITNVFECNRNNNLIIIIIIMIMFLYFIIICFCCCFVSCQIYIIQTILCVFFVLHEGKGKGVIHNEGRETWK